MIHKISFTFILIFSLLLNCINVNAQEVLVPLSTNPVIKEYLLTEHKLSKPGHRIQSITDTVERRFFIDDFSYPGIYPTSSLWIDSNAFINSTFCDNPVTIGVATLDGINKYGNPYNPFSLSTTPDTADFLTSNPIRLSPGSVGMWLRFYYQPQGIGEEPDIPDSLTLQFRSLSGDWNTVWSVPGHANRPFQRVNIPLNDPIYEYPGFQFRFMNYATLNGNLDHWNLDYVRIDSAQTQNDSAIVDISFVNPIKSFLSEYSAMPYSHYKNFVGNGHNPVKDSVSDIIRIFSIPSTSATPYCDITDENSLSIFNHIFDPGTFSTIGIENSDIKISLDVPNSVFSSGGSKYADFFIKYAINSLSSSFPTNDFSFYTQHFQNYYAYDDGSAEVAYGINEAGAKVAYRFDVKMADTLRGVKIYFNQVGEQVHNKLFQLCYWNNVDVAGNTDHLVYKTINQKPANIDSINGFATYLFDSMLIVPAGPMYVGWIQNDATILGMGVDKNTPNNNNMFYYLTGHWHPSATPGVWMMRPLFGDALIRVGINEPVAESFSFDIYPNPASSSVAVEVHSGKNTLYDYQLLSYLGQGIKSGKISSGKIDLSDLSNGFYFIRLIDLSTNQSVIKKLVVQHDKIN